MEFICNFELEIVHAQDTESVNACFNPEFIYSKVNFVARINFILSVDFIALGIKLNE